jgi:hypothetical protein
MSYVKFSGTSAAVIPAANPLGVIEEIAIANAWSFEREAEDEIAFLVTGNWVSYNVSFTWMSEIEVLHLACAFDLRPPEPRRSAVQDLISSINEQLWLGHFDIWAKPGIVLFRHSIPLAGGTTVSPRQCEVILGSALDSCERYYPAFQYVAWAGKSASDAMGSVMLETAGEA